MKRPLLAWVLFFTAYLVLYGYRLDFPRSLYYDEIFNVQTARDFIHLTKLTDTVHPPLGRLLISCSILMFGDQPWAWRLPSLLCGFGVLAVLYLLVKKGLGNSLTAFIAVFLFFFDCLSFTQARIAMVNTAMLFFTLLSVYFLLKHAAWKEWPRRRSFLLSGLFFGFAWGTKWLAFGIFFVVGFFLIKLWREERSGKSVVLDFIKYFVPISFAAYSSTFIPMLFIRGYEPLAVLKTQLHMILSHLILRPDNPNRSEWWTWPLLLKPAWYFFQEQAYTSLKAHYNINAIIAIGNPVIYWLIPFSVIGLAAAALRNRSWLYGFIVLGFLFQWLPFSLFSRQQYIHYFYVVMPFAVVMLAIFLEKIWRKNKLGAAVSVSFLVLTAGMFFYWYPLVSGLTVSTSYYQNHLWLSSWR